DNYRDDRRSPPNSPEQNCEGNETMARLAGKIAVITGGAQGIGRAIALGMAREGAKLVVADLQEGKAEAVAGEARALGAEAIAVAVDVSDEKSVQNLADRSFERFGRVDILVNDAGVYLKAPVIRKTEADWDRTLNVNLGGNFLCARAFVPAMRRQKAAASSASLRRSPTPAGASSPITRRRRRRSWASSKRWRASSGPTASP